MTSSPRLPWMTSEPSPPESRSSTRLHRLDCRLDRGGEGACDPIPVLIAHTGWVGSFCASLRAPNAPQLLKEQLFFCEADDDRYDRDGLPNATAKRVR